MWATYLIGHGSSSLSEKRLLAANWRVNLEGSVSQTPGTGLRGQGLSLGSKSHRIWIYPVAVLATACPEVGGASPFSILNVVLFPAPLGPRSPKHYVEKRHR